jgi:hypothetical protein
MRINVSGGKVEHCPGEPRLGVPAHYRLVLADELTLGSITSNRINLPGTGERDWGNGFVVGDDVHLNVEPCYLSALSSFETGEIVDQGGCPIADRLTAPRSTNDNFEDLAASREI